MLIKRDLIEERRYQIDIANSASRENTLIVLPTGLGKSLIAMLVAERRLQKFENSKILITAPTRPLVAQHKKLFEKFTNLNEEEIGLVTGKIRKEKRKEIYEKYRIISATPQCVQNDLKAGILNLSDFSLLVVDECHRAVKGYPYPYVAKKFMIQSKNPIILGLTASPGATQEKIDEICENLFIKNVEIRTEVDRDVERYVKKVKWDWIYVNLPIEYERIRKMLLEIAEDNLSWLKEYGFVSRRRLTKKEILSLQERLVKRVSKKRPILFAALRKVAHLLKIEHAMELLETQDVSALAEYLGKLSRSKRRTDKILMNSEKMRKTRLLVDAAKGKEHPKLKKLVQIAKEVVKRNEGAKIIIFANYRRTVEKICNELRKNSISAEILIGQARRGRKGLTQKKQLEVLKRFSNLEFNVLCGTSITEEGLDVPQVDYIIFYEPVPSEIRTIQRRGRTGRTAPGRVIFLITKKTRDEAYYWAAFRKEKRMKKILRKLQEEKTLARRKTLLDWIKY